VNEAWIVMGICLIFVVGAALPLIHRGAGKTPPPPPRETLRDWRSGE
jgi:hypothetical protein